MLAALIVVLGLGCGLTASAAERHFWEGWWLPEGVCSYDNEIDTLFYGILALTGFVFVATEAVLLVFIFKYRRKEEGQKSYYTHGNHIIEMIWTVTPAVILIFIALVQAKTWTKVKDPTQFPSHTAGTEPVNIQLIAKQFSWFFRYPNEKGKFGVEGESVTTERELVVPVHTPIIIEQTSVDVIHSFFLPYMRLKQDAVPGMHIKVWFDANKTTAEMRETRPKMTMEDPKRNMREVTWDYPIVCAELCGIQHYQMFGKVTVLPKPEYDKWLANKRAAKDDEAEYFAKYWKVDQKTGERVYGEEDGNLRTALPVPYAVAHPEVLEGHGSEHAEKHEEKKADEKKPDEKKSDEKKADEKK